MPTNKRFRVDLQTEEDSAVYWVKYYRNGKAFRESTKTTNKQEAKDFLKKRLGEIATGNFYGPLAERVTIAELADDFLRDYRIQRAEVRWMMSKHVGTCT